MAVEDFKSVVVTGASSGIGAATVRQLSARGVTVHAMARRTERLAALAEETGCVAHALDVRDRDAVYGTLGELGADALVNNAGLGRAFDGLVKGSADDIDITLDTNVNAALHVVRAVLPAMQAAGHGHIVNMSSVAAHYPVFSSVYGASKGAVHLFSQNLRIELAGQGIRVTEINPGRVATEFFDKALDDEDKRKGALNVGYPLLQAEDVASAVVYALDVPAHVQISMVELMPSGQVFGGTRFGAG